MTVKEIIKDYLKQNGFDGLFNANEGCGCELKDLFCRDCICENCEPGYKHLCPEGHEFDWLITNSKEKPDFLEE